MCPHLVPFVYQLAMSTMPDPQTKMTQKSFFDDAHESEHVSLPLEQSRC